MLGGGEGGQVIEELEVEEGDQQQMKGVVAECILSDAVRGPTVNTTESNVAIDEEPSEESLGECEPVGLTLDRHLSDGIALPESVDIALPESVDIALPEVEGIERDVEDDSFTEKDALEEASTQLDDVTLGNRCTVDSIFHSKCYFMLKVSIITKMQDFLWISLHLTKMSLPSS